MLWIVVIDVVWLFPSDDVCRRRGDHVCWFAAEWSTNLGKGGPGPPRPGVFRFFLLEKFNFHDWTKDLLSKWNHSKLQLVLTAEELVRTSCIFVTAIYFLHSASEKNQLQLLMKMLKPANRTASLLTPRGHQRWPLSWGVNFAVAFTVSMLLGRSKTNGWTLQKKHAACHNCLICFTMFHVHRIYNIAYIAYIYNFIHYLYWIWMSINILSIWILLWCWWCCGWSRGCGFEKAMEVSVYPAFVRAETQEERPNPKCFHWDPNTYHCSLVDAV